MTLLQFAQSLNSITSKSSLIAAIGSFVDDHSNKESDKSKLQSFIETISDEDFTSFGQNIGFCKNHCLDELSKDSNKFDEDYRNKLNEVKQLLDELSSIYQRVNENREQKKIQIDESYTIVQQKDVLRELVQMTNSLKTDVAKANEDIAKANDSLDNKMFSLLINTVAILGIFVAIAFAGLGITSLFNNLDFAIAFSSKESFVRTIFFLLLITLLSYNLLLLLVYFIFKLSRPILNNTKETQNSDISNKFRESIQLKPFFWIDGILFSLTIVVLVYIWTVM